MEALKGYCGVDARSDGLNGSVFWFAFPYRPDFAFECGSYEGKSSKTLRSSSLKKSSYSTCDSDKSLKPSLIAVDNALYYSVENLFNRVTSSTIPLRILVVDDSNSILKITSRALRAKGHQVKVAENGSIGLEKMKSAFLTQDFDVLLTDLQMPVLDGLEFVRRFREYENQEMQTHGNDITILRKCSNNNGRLYIVGMSANSDSVSRQEALAIGMDTFISKPFVYEDFSQALQSIVVH